MIPRFGWGEGNRALEQLPRANGVPIPQREVMPEYSESGRMIRQQLHRPLAVPTRQRHPLICSVKVSTRVPVVQIRVDSDGFRIAWPGGEHRLADRFAELEVT